MTIIHVSSKRVSVVAVLPISLHYTAHTPSMSMSTAASIDDDATATANIVLIGAGWWSQGWHLPHLQRNEKVTIAAIIGEELGLLLFCIPSFVIALENYSHLSHCLTPNSNPLFDSLFKTPLPTLNPT